MSLDRIIKQNIQSLIKESMGVPNEAIELSKEIVDAFIKDIWVMQSKALELESANEDDEEDDDSYGYYSYSDWEDEFEYNFIVGEYEISVFYDSRNGKKAETDGDGEISINFAQIKRLLDKCHERCERLKELIPNYGENEFHSMAENEVKEYLTPVVMHELTHNSDKIGGSHDYIWLKKYHRLNEGDLREMLYLFCDQELNARVSSAYAIMENLIHEILFDYKFQGGTEFYEFVEENVLSEKEFEISSMETYLNLVQRDLDFSDKGYMKRIKQEKGHPYSLAYDLFLNDSRLRNNKKLAKLFNENYRSGVRYVVNFYNNLLTNFKKRIIRACWYAYTKSLEQK